MTPVLQYENSELTADAKQRSRWAQDKLAEIRAGARFDHLPIGHDAFVGKVYEEYESAQDALLEFIELAFR
jgi:hypothetical protein